MHDIPINIKSLSMSSEELSELHQQLSKVLGVTTGADEVAYRKEVARLREQVRKLEGIISSLRKETNEQSQLIASLRGTARALRNEANNIRLQYARRFNDNKKLRFEIVEQKRLIRLMKGRADRAEAVVDLLTIPNQTVEENKNERDRDILSEFVITPGDSRDDALVHRKCTVVEWVPCTTDLLRVYFAARSHIEKHHKGES